MCVCACVCVYDVTKSAAASAPALTGTVTVPPTAVLTTTWYSLHEARLDELGGTIPPGPHQVRSRCSCGGAVLSGEQLRKEMQCGCRRKGSEPSRKGPREGSVRSRKGSEGQGEAVIGRERQYVEPPPPNNRAAAVTASGFSCGPCDGNSVRKRSAGREHHAISVVETQRRAEKGPRCCTAEAVATLTRAVGGSEVDCPRSGPYSELEAPPCNSDSGQDGADGDALRGSRRKHVSGSQQQLVSQIGVSDHTSRRPCGQRPAICRIR